MGDAGMNSRFVRAATTLTAAGMLALVGVAGASTAASAAPGSGTFTVTTRDQESSRSIGTGVERNGGFDDGSGQLRIAVRDRIDGHPLPGARFAITTCAGHPRGSGATDAQGLLIRTLPTGCYRAREEVAPSGYVENGATGTIHVESDATDHHEILATPVGHVSGRDVGKRVPLSGIVAGPTDRP
ncbi:MSCRAMM family protein [Gordonia sputi]|uniref:MSCRAMM family protein n=1 Tax=Gordonia sputi TaxID=36823 RepID=UPI002044A3C4|nr:prealbumin-like fold domain-containing protein [Gordonia sputi]MCM3894011.1 prealbumin-like fold domain-containing protein [Gordonia sputi]